MEQRRLFVLRKRRRLNEVEERKGYVSKWLEGHS